MACRTAHLERPLMCMIVGCGSRYNSDGRDSRGALHTASLAAFVLYSLLSLIIFV